MKVHKLDDSVIGQIKYHLHFNTFHSIVESILGQCLQYRATRIEIKIDFQSLAIFVQSNDVGLTPEQLEELCTSNKFGGLEVVSNLKIISKSQQYNCPYKIIATKNPKAQLCSETTDLNTSYCNLDPLGHHGTIYIVSNIFNNLPVRKAQLKATPVYKIVDGIKMVLLKVLFNNYQVEKVNLELYNSQKFKFEEIVSTNAASEVKLLQDLFDIEVQFKPVKASFKHYYIDGVIGLQTTRSKGHQYVFVNNQLMPLSKSEVAAINDIFEDFGEKDPSPKRKTVQAYATFLMSITCNKEVTKDSYSWSVVIDLLKRVFAKFVRMGLSKKPLTNEHVFTLSPCPKRAKTDKFILNTNVRWGDVNSKEIEGMVSCGKSHHIKPRLQPPRTTITTHRFNYHHHHHQQHQSDSPTTAGYELTHFAKLRLSKYRIIKQIDKKFILVVIDNKLVVLDQHATDERIKVEELMQEFVSNLPQNLRLAHPMRINVTSSEHLILQQYSANFKSWGIIYHFDEGDNDLVVTNVPQLLMNNASDQQFIKNALLQHCYDLQNNVKNQLFHDSRHDWFTIMFHVPQFIINVINSRACRSAVMFGDGLSKSEMRDLIDKLSKCKLPFQCAHGRPSIVPLVNLHSNE
ncbi:MLH3 [Candida margitis]|uniref:MLH3 n=1 Tax=Candida margitis TaxID=1775924 RepID=UPI0022276315|nr:MLH3 [Candida margitis]KAI5967516.1 MLH3 [Candida margitis]